MSLNLQEIHKLASVAASEGRQVLLSYFGRLSKVQEKDLAGLVSEADLACEKKIEEVLAQGRPDISFLGEERSYLEKIDASELTPGTRWILDPLDGTTNYIHGFYAYGISLALEWQGEVVYGLVDLPSLNVRYHAMKGAGAFKDGQRMQVSQSRTLATSLVATGFSSSRKDVLCDQLASFSKVVQHVRGVRRTGSAAYDICLVAEGVFDAYWESGLQAWDVAAGSLIATESKGRVTHLSGAPLDIYQGSLLVSNGHVHDELLGLLQV